MLVAHLPACLRVATNSRSLGAASELPATLQAHVRRRASPELGCFSMISRMGCTSPALPAPRTERTLHARVDGLR